MSSEGGVGTIRPSRLVDEVAVVHEICFFVFVLLEKKYTFRLRFFSTSKRLFFRGNTLIMRFCMFTRRISLAGLEKQIQIIIIINGSMNF